MSEPTNPRGSVTATDRHPAYDAIDEFCQNYDRTIDGEWVEALTEALEGAGLLAPRGGIVNAAPDGVLSAGSDASPEISRRSVGEVAVLQAAEAEIDTRWTLLVNLIEALDRCGVIFEDRSVIDAITAARNYVEDGVIPAVAGLVEAETPETPSED